MCVCNGAPAAWLPEYLELTGGTCSASRSMRELMRSRRCFSTVLWLMGPLRSAAAPGAVAKPERSQSSPSSSSQSKSSCFIAGAWRVAVHRFLAGVELALAPLLLRGLLALLPASGALACLALLALALTLAGCLCCCR